MRRDRLKSIAINIILAAAVAMAVAVPAAAGGADPKTTTESIYDSWGNQARNRVVAQSTTTVVLLSSAPASAGTALGLTDWRARIIENRGTQELVLYGDNTTFTIYQSSAGIHVSSDTINQLNRFVWYGQGPIYGIWNSTGTSSGGASVTEFYFRAR